MEKVKIKYPKSISLQKTTGEYQVVFYSKVTKKSIGLKSFSTIAEAVKERDKFIVNNYNGILKGYLPRGLSYSKEDKTYMVRVSINRVQFYVGCKKDLQSAINLRNRFLDSLK